MSDMPNVIWAGKWCDCHGWVMEWDEESMSDSAAAECDGFAEQAYIATPDVLALCEAVENSNLFAMRPGEFSKRCADCDSNIKHTPRCIATLAAALKQKIKEQDDES